MEFIDLHAQYQRQKNQIDQAIKNVLEHGQFIRGPEITRLEERLAKYVGTKHAIVLSSGTLALHAALMALEIQPGDEVITSPFSFFATAEVVFLTGAKPIYVDIDPKTYNIDVSLIEAAITPRTKAIMPVSLYGQCPDFDAINALAKKYKLAVIEDGAQSFGAEYKGRKSCGLSTIGCTSFFPSKPLGCYGDGGACFTNDDDLASRMRLFIDHGQSSRYHHIALGMNGRLSTLQAAVLLTKLDIFNDELQQRQKIAAWYQKELAGTVTLPYVESHNCSAYAQYTIQTENRDQLQKMLSAQQIPTSVHYPKGLHQQPIALALYPEPKHFPITEAAAQRVLSLPFHPYMTEAQVKQVSSAIINSKITQ